MVNQIFKPDVMSTELILGQLVDASTQLTAVIERIASSQQSRGSLARPTTASPSRPLQAADLRRLLKLRSRQRRKATGQFLDWPAWDILLDLASVRVESGHLSVSAVCVSSGAPQSTALRKLTALESAGLIRRYLYGTDRRRVCVALTDQGAEFVTEAMAEEVAFFQGASC